MSEIKNRKLDLYGAENSKCSRAMTLVFKELNIPEGTNISWFPLTKHVDTGSVP